jgi:hypothetical protein
VPNKKKPEAYSKPKKPIPLPEEGVEPDSEDEVERNNFLRALSAGNPVAAAKSLRKIDELTHVEREILADLLDGDPVLAHQYPYRLQLVPRKRGKPPVDYLTKIGREQAIARAVIRAIAEFGKLEAAIAHVQHQHKQRTKQTLSRSTIMKCYSAHRESFRKKSP